MHMEIGNVVLFLLLSILSLPCFLLLIILTEALLRAAAPLLQRQAGSHFAWPPNSAFRLPAPPAAAAFRTKSPPSPPSDVDALRVATYRRADVSFSSSSASAAASKAAAEDADDDACCCCVFCLCDVEEGDEIREIPCRHVFHRRCLDTWLQHRRATCPLCRSRLGGEVGDEDEDELEESATILVAYVHSSGWWARYLDDDSSRSLHDEHFC